MRVLLVPDTKTAMDSLISIANAVTTKIKEGKQSYFQTLHEKHLVPKHVPQTHGLPPKLAIPAEYAQSASVRVASALRHFAATMELPENEDVALQTFLGNLENIARADDVAFRGLPFLSRTKNIVQAFFGTKRGNPVDDSCGISAEDVPQSAQQWKSPSRFDARLQQLTPTRALPFSSPAACYSDERRFWSRSCPICRSICRSLSLEQNGIPARKCFLESRSYINV
jgi:hypothetical protein